MTFAPATLLALRSYLADRTGLSAVQLGIVGDANHRSGYHLGWDWIKAKQGTADYSVRLARDAAGLTNAASAIDIGMFDRLRDLSVWLVERCRSDTLDTRDIREVIYSPDGVKVLRWDRARGVSSVPTEGEASLSHRTHTHVSYFRDSELRVKLGPFVAYFEGVTDMSLWLITAQVRERWHPTVANGRSNGVLRSAPDRSLTPFIRLGEDISIVTVAEIRTVAGPDGDWRLVEWPGRETLYVLRSDWISDGFLDEPVALPDPTAYNRGYQSALDDLVTDIVARR